VVHEILNKFRFLKGKRGYVALKLDMEEGYDRIEWDFLFSCLIEMGFHRTWINWIKEYVTIVSYFLIINKKTCGFFKPTSGLRQGDPLSPYLFIICMDILAQRLYQQASLPKSGIGIQIAKGAHKIPCLFFMDDSLLFCKTTTQACQNLNNILANFCQASSQVINFYKSIVVFSKSTTTADNKMWAVFLTYPKERP